MTQPVLELPSALTDGFNQVNKSLDGKIHLLASKGDEELSSSALQVVKHLFDLGESNVTGAFAYESC